MLPLLIILIAWLSIALLVLAVVRSAARGDRADAVGRAQAVGSSRNAHPYSRRGIRSRMSPGCVSAGRPAITGSLWIARPDGAVGSGSPSHRRRGQSA